METKRTEMTKHYWNNEGAYETEMKELTDRFMPASGAAKTFVGEVVRAANRLYYEYCNNGNGNACEIHTETQERICDTCSSSGYITDEDGNEVECPDCGGSGCWDDEVVDEYAEMDKYYGAFVGIIRQAFKEDNMTEGLKAIDAVEGVIMSYSHYSSKTYFSDENMHKYDLMIDNVVEYAMRHASEERPLPADYANND